MAIRGHAYWGHTSGSYFADATLVGFGPGTPLVLMDPSAASGKPGDANNLVGPSLGASGEVFVGVLKSTVYDWDKTKCCFHPEQFQSAATECTPVNVAQDFEGLFDSDSLDLTGTPDAGDAVYLGAAGKFSNVGNVVVGVFTGAPDADGSVSIRLHR